MAPRESKVGISAAEHTHEVFLQHYMVFDKAFIFQQMLFHKNVKAGNHTWIFLGGDINHRCLKFGP